MIDFHKHRFSVQDSFGHWISFDTYNEPEKVKAAIKSQYISFNNFTEFEPQRFKADMKTENFTGSLEMYSTTRKEFISKCEMLNDCINEITYEEIPDDE